MPTLTTKQAVLATAPELATIPDPPPPAVSEWRQALEDVAVELPGDNLGDAAELAQRLWVAHVLTLAHPEVEPRQVASVSAGGVSKSFASAAPAAGDGWGRTRHGLRLQSLLAGRLPSVLVL